MNNSKLSLFLSYARHDLEVADQLATALDAFGFPTTIDRLGIFGAENWEQRLTQLIFESDTVVFLLTPHSAASEYCHWEVDTAIRMQKRIVPILAAPLGSVEPHKHLRDLNYIHLYAEPSMPSSGFGSGLARLIAALSIDIEWTREHTRFSSLTQRWSAANRLPDLLVRGSELARLQGWRDSRPSSGPELTALQRDFIQASEDAENLRLNEELQGIEERKQALKEVEDAQYGREIALQRLSRRTMYGLAGVLVLAVLAVIAAVIAWQQNQSLQEASLRLREGMKLKIAKTEHLVTTTEKWYRIATDYKLSVGVYHASTAFGSTAEVGSGFLVKGESLRAEWGNQLVFLTARHVLRAYLKGDNSDLGNAFVTFPGTGDSTRFRFDRILYESSTWDVAVLRIIGAIPRHAIGVDLDGQIESKDALEGIAVLHWTAQDGFALGFGHGLANSGTDAPLTMRDRLTYTHVTGGGASGAPVFDTNSGKVVCLHIGGIRSVPRSIAYCSSISRIVAAIKETKVPHESSGPLRGLE